MNFSSLNILRIFPTTPQKIVFTYNSQNAGTILLKFFISVRCINSHVW
jgi:hypothetical protein